MIFFYKISNSTKWLKIWIIRFLNTLMKSRQVTQTYSHLNWPSQHRKSHITNCIIQFILTVFILLLRESIDNLTIIFTNTEKRLSWESTFNDAKKRLSLTSDHRTKPEFLLSLPIRKTRAGLQISCASSTLGYNHFGFKDVWICNSDGYVGQVCVLSLHTSPTVTSCNGVCNARILCATAVPALPANL